MGRNEVPIRLVAAAAATAVLIVLTGTALGQEVDPENPVPDTQYTPVAKPGEERAWARIGGAEFGEQSAPDDSPTPHTVDFFTVRFQSDEIGFAGGAACSDSDTSFDELAGCDRVPAMYRFLDADGPLGEEPGRWERFDLPGDDRPGYVAGVAWIGPGRAIAIGGTGTYPRRELKRREGEPDDSYAERDEAEGAGMARVWQYHAGRWRELEADDLQVSGQPAMRALTSVDCSPRPGDGGLCVAGGLRQLWTFQGGLTGDGHFEKAYTEQSPEADFEDAAGFRYRVRDVRFVPGSQTPAVQVAAVTSGCCGATEADNSPRLLLFDGAKWYARLLAYDAEGTRVGAVPVVGAVPGADRNTLRAARPRQSLPDSYYSLYTDQSRLSTIATPGGPLPAAGAPDEAVGEPVSRVIGNVELRTPNQGSDASRALTNPAAVTDTAPAGAVTGAAYDGGVRTEQYTGNLASELLNPNLSSMRLVSGDGDFFGQRGRTSTQPFNPAPVAPDGVIDWAVGELRASGQGIAYTTLDTHAPVRDALDCPSHIGKLVDPAQEVQDAATECEARDAASVQGGAESTRLVSLPSYALNSFSYVPLSETAWAVGDKGALLSLGGTGATGGGGGGEEPDPAPVGSRQAAELSADSTFAGVGPPLSNQPGMVPALGDHDRVRLPEPRLVPYGIPDPTRPRTAAPEEVTQIVMSRDGSEGWATGGRHQGDDSGAHGTTLYHWDGAAWTRCDTETIAEQVKPAPACAALAPLREYRTEGRPDPVALTVAARVPLEHDSDPSNDDEFEVVAVGEGIKLEGVSGERDVVARYHGGRWEIDTEATAALNLTPTVGAPKALVFDSPSDGWLVMRSGPAEPPSLIHFDGDRWINCSADQAACGDPGQLLPLKAGTAAPGLYLSLAGRRLYLGGTRKVGASGVGVVAAPTTYPVILYKDLDKDGPWGVAHDPGCASREGGACGPDDSSEEGLLNGISVARTAEGGYEGWASGLFGGSEAMRLLAGPNFGSEEARQLGEIGAFLRLEPSSAGTEWSKWDLPDAARDYVGGAFTQPDSVPALLTQPGTHGGFGAWFTPGGAEQRGEDPLSPALAFESGRWRAAGTPFAMTKRLNNLAVAAVSGLPTAIAPDGEGGLWVSARQNRGDLIGHDGRSSAAGAMFYRYSDQAPREVFEEAPHPIREEITSGAGGPDGSFWVATNAGTIYRYDRVGGWDRVPIPGWDRGRVVTRRTPVTAIAVGPDGRGVAVGEGGRIANLDPRAVRLDAAAGVACGTDLGGPCGTGQDLRAAAAGPSGSAMVGGAARSLLYKPPGGDFQPIAKPPTAPNATITGISLPSAGQAWLTTNLGQIWVGEGSGHSWSWRVENRHPETGQVLSIDEGGSPLPLRSVAVDAMGHGYAVGDRGVIIERRGGGSQPWHRLDTAIHDDLTAVALPASGSGPGALVGGHNNVIYTRTQRGFAPTRHSDIFDPITSGPGNYYSGRIVGLAVLPGYEAGQVEAWAATQAPPPPGDRNPAPGAILHYSSDDSEPLLNPELRSSALPDSPERRDGEIAIAAFGRSDCQLVSRSNAPLCSEPQDSNLFNDLIPRRIAGAIKAESEARGGRLLSVFTGDFARASGRESADPSQQPQRNRDIPLDPNVIGNRWAELVAGRFQREQLSLFGAIGRRDRSQVQSCNLVARCISSQNDLPVSAGDSGPWRQSMASMPGPWGVGDGPAGDHLTVRAVASGGSEVLGGALTHYAFDVIDNSQGGTAVLRMAFLDSSMGSLQASDPDQNPTEATGQTAWLREVLCVQGSAADTGDCTRVAGQPAAVVSTTPTYTYGPGALTDTAADVATVEQILLENQVSALISGRIGWNGLYYTLAPGLHTPCPGGSHPSAPPEGDLPQCGPTEGGPNPNQLVSDLQGQLGGAGEAGGVLPGIIASSAGGRFGPHGTATGSGSEGFWHGYTLVRIPADGDPSRTIVEQRPIFDWVSLTANRRVLRAGKTAQLLGEGREAAGIDAPLRYDDVASPAITHRYDLLAAVPDEPWLPVRDAAPPAGIAPDGPEQCGPYVCLDPRVGRLVDPEAGTIKAGNGSYPRTYGVAMLSVGEQSATYPMAFEPRASFQNPTPPPPRPVAPVPPPPPPAQPPQPNQPVVDPVVPPALPLITVATLPAPPVPPAPPTFASQAPIDLNIGPSAIDVQPPTAVTQPPTPPVNPAPPSGARREARQRQAAAQKSGADSGEERADEGAGDSHGRIDAADSPNASMSRAERSSADGGSLSFSRGRPSRPRPSLNPVAHAEPPSAWVRDALLGGGLTVTALLFAFGYTRARPTPRRREPEAPAPAWARGRRR